MTDLPTEARELMAAATERPWTAFSHVSDGQGVYIPPSWGVYGHGHEAGHTYADIALIVLLANNAESFVAAVEAVERVRARLGRIYSIHEPSERADGTWRCQGCGRVWVESADEPGEFTKTCLTVEAADGLRAALDEAVGS